MPSFAVFGTHGWKDKMRNDFQARASWMNKKFSCNSHAVGTPESSADNLEQGAARLRAYRKSLGEQVRMSQEEKESAVNLIVDKLHPLVAQCPKIEGRPSITAFKHQLRRTKGCAGMDGWSKNEIKTILCCNELVQEIWDEMGNWEDTGMVPTSVRNIRVACLAKETKVVEHTLKPENRGPISVPSVFWRTWSATWLKSKYVDVWRKLLFPKNISGGYPGAWGPDLLAAITNQHLMKWKYAVSLHFSHAFDTINTRVVQDVLLRILPKGCHVWALLTEHWMNLKRWFCLGGQTHSPKPADIGCWHTSRRSCFSTYHDDLTSSWI